MYQRGLLPQAHYLFKHALIQDTAYQSLLKSKRQQFHQQIAQVLEERFPETVETQPELLAHHYTEAGLIEQAIPYWQQAGQRASAALGLCRSDQLTSPRGWSCSRPCRTRPSVPSKNSRCKSPWVVADATKGFAAPEVEKAYARARELCQQVGETPQLFPVLWGLWMFYISAGESYRRPMSWRSSSSSGPERTRSALLLEAHSCTGEDLVLAGRVCPCPRTLGARDCPLRPSAAPLPCLSLRA